MTTPSARARALLLQAFRAATLLGACGYLGLVLLYVLPDNPLQAQLEPVSRRVVGGYFRQAWGMFAPSPPAVGVTVLARCHAGARTSPWLELSAPRPRSPLPMRVRLSSYVQETVRAEWRLGEDARALREGRPGAPTAAALERRRTALQERWAHLGSVACMDVLGDGLGDTASGAAPPRVEVRRVEVALEAWATRGAPLPPPVETELGTFALQQDRVRPGLWRLPEAP